MTEHIQEPIPEHIALLIEADIDGNITETEASELADAASAEPAIAEALENARLAQQFVASQTILPAPEGFTDAVMAALPERVAWEQVARQPAAQQYAVRPARPRRSLWTLSLGLTAVAACILVVIMFVVPGMNPGGMQATMISPDHALTTGSEDVSISVRQVADEIVIHVISGRAAPVQIAFNPSWSTTPIPVAILAAEASDEYRLPVRPSDSGTLILTGTTPEGEILFRNELQVQP